LLDSLTVEENVGLGLTERSSFSPIEIRRIVAEKLEMVGMPRTQKLMPADLSGGMKKRVGLARAIAMDPEIILYDEPTTGLDPIMSDTINELILNLKFTLHTTPVIVTHDMFTVRKVADRVAMLENGKIVFSGTIDELETSAIPVVRQFISGRCEFSPPELNRKPS
jgi:phospholipid/cholesterol/gamma-HCH transport system ATP-binding protein